MSSIGSNILEFADKWMDGGQERLLFVALSFIASAGTFYSVNLVVSIINHYDLYPEKRVRRPPYMKPTPPELIRKAWMHVHFLLLSSPVLMSYVYYLYKWRGSNLSLSAPNFGEIIIYLSISAVFEDTVFYWGHRMLHLPDGVAALYAHPFEDMINLIATYGGTFISGAPLSFADDVAPNRMVLRVWEGVDAHCGYVFDWSPWSQFPSIQGGAERHDFHHFNNKGCYGSLTKNWTPALFLEEISGTNLACSLGGAVRTDKLYVIFDTPS
eukprot:gene6297-7462_t